MAVPVLNGKTQFLDAAGVSLGLGAVSLYVPGTTTPKQTWQDQAKTILNTTPTITLDAGGYAMIYGTGAYRQIVKDVLGNIIWDQVAWANDPDDTIATIEALYAAASGAGLIGVSHDQTYAQGTEGDHFQRFVCVTDAPYNAKGDGVTNDYAAFAAAVAALPASGGTIWVPDATGYVLNSEVVTGTKKVVWIIGATTITCPAGAAAFRLQSNGSAVRANGPNSTILKLRTPTSAVTYPSVVTALSAGAVSTATPSGGSGIVTTPVTLPADSPSTGATNTPDALLVSTVSGGTVSAIAVVGGGGGSGYVAAPAVSFIGGGACAVIIDGVQGCEVGGFSIDFQNVAGSTGVVHRGGWWAHIHDVQAVYNVATGISSESTTTIGILVDSYTRGAPGPSGDYGGCYVGTYERLKFQKRAVIGHDTSTATTLQFSSCDFNNSYLHACIAITDINVVHQGNTGAYYDLGNVDGLIMAGGDREGSATWYHFRGSCSNIRDLGVLSYSATGTVFRGQANSGYFYPGKANSTDFPLDIGSLSSGVDSQNSGFAPRHRWGISFDGNWYTVGATNLRPISTTQGNLDDVSQGGIVVLTNVSKQLLVMTADAGANPRTMTLQFQMDGGVPYFPNLPAAAGPSKSLWHDPADGNRVKWVP